MADLYRLKPVTDIGRRFAFICDDVEIGSVVLLRGREDHPTRLEIWSLEILPEYRGLGHSHALMNAIHATAKAEGFTTIWLRVDKENQAAIALYVKHEFAIIGERIHDFEMEKQL